MLARLDLVDELGPIGFLLFNWIILINLAVRRTQNRTNLLAPRSVFLGLAWLHQRVKGLRLVQQLLHPFVELLVVLGKHLVLAVEKRLEWFEQVVALEHCMCR